ncbi:hypothetical protein OF83DRAFT_1087298 [Amylostereum chailletii]|nr:hypothetical protein OF83DRAFT_1087298 [Amylostereum chailletii]
MSGPNHRKTTAFPVEEVRPTDSSLCVVEIDLSTPDLAKECLEQSGRAALSVLARKKDTMPLSAMEAGVVLATDAEHDIAVRTIVEKALPRTRTLLLDEETFRVVRDILIRHPACALEDLEIRFTSAGSHYQLTSSRILWETTPQTLRQLALSNCCFLNPYDRALFRAPLLRSLVLNFVRIWQSVEDMVNVLNNLGRTLEELVLANSLPPATGFGAELDASHRPRIVLAKLQRLSIEGSTEEVVATAPWFYPLRSACAVSLSFWTLPLAKDVDQFGTFLCHWRFVEATRQSDAAFKKLVISGRVSAEETEWRIIARNDLAQDSIESSVIPRRISFVFRYLNVNVQPFLSALPGAFSSSPYLFVSHPALIKFADDHCALAAFTRTIGIVISGDVSTHILRALLTSSHGSRLPGCSSSHQKLLPALEWVMVQDVSLTNVPDSSPSRRLLDLLLEILPFQLRIGMCDVQEEDVTKLSLARKVNGCPETWWDGMKTRATDISPFRTSIIAGLN